MFDGLDTSVLPLYVHPADFHRWAERVRPMLACMAAGSGGCYLAEDIAAAISAGRMQLWLALDGTDIACTMVTEIVAYPRLRAMRCVGVVGHRPLRWMHMLEDVERAARDCFGCTRFQALVQPGHERLLRTGGWRLFHSLWEKPL